MENSPLRFLKDNDVINNDKWRSS